MVVVLAGAPHLTRPFRLHLPVRTKRKVYGSPAEFENDRTKMWSKGWLVQEQRTVQVAKPSWATLNSESFVAIILSSPLLLLGWMIYRNAPDEEIVVTFWSRDGEPPG